MSCVDHWHCDSIAAHKPQRRERPCPSCGAAPFVRGCCYATGDRVVAMSDASFGRFLFRGTVAKVFDKTDSGRQLVEVRYDAQLGVESFVGVELADDLRPLDLVARIGELEIA